VNITLFGCPKTGKTTLFNLPAGAHDGVAVLYPEKKKMPAPLDLTDVIHFRFAA